MKEWLTALVHNDAGIVDFHDFGHDGFEEAVECGISVASPQRDIQGVKFASLLSMVIQRPRSREEIESILMEADCHYPAARFGKGILYVQPECQSQLMPEVQLSYHVYFRFQQHFSAMTTAICFL